MQVILVPSIAKSLLLVISTPAQEIAHHILVIMDNINQQQDNQVVLNVRLVLMQMTKRQ
jgi:hypothetical protein